MISIPHGKKRWKSFGRISWRFSSPTLHSDVDWSRGYQSLDKELEKIHKKTDVGKRLADKLFKVWRENGEETWVLIHVEVQAQRDVNFPERMFVYNYRIFERYKRKVVSLAVLADDNPNWRPNQYESTLWGCELLLRFPIVKLLDYANDTAALESHPNAFGLLVAAHLQSQTTRNADQTRFAAKIRLVKLLMDRTMSVEQVHQLFRFIDWLMELPNELEERFDNEIFEYQKEKKMPYISSLERKAIERGWEKGMEKGMEKGREEGQRELLLKLISSGLQTNHPDSVDEIMELVEHITDVNKLQNIPPLIWRGESLEKIREALTEK